MTYSTVTVQLTDNQIKKLGSKNAKECGITMTLKPAQMTGGSHKLSLTTTQLGHYNKAALSGKGVRLVFSKAAVADMIKNGGIFPFLAAIPGILAAALPAIGKAAALGAVSSAAGIGLKKALGQGYKRGGKQGGLLPPSMMLPLLATMGPVLAQRGFISKMLKKTTGQGYKKKKRLTTRKTTSVLTPMSNFDLIEAVKKLKIKNFRGVFMRDQLPGHANNPETGIINPDGQSGPGTHWVAYAITPRSIVYFDSYGLAPPKEFLKYISGIPAPFYYSTLPTQQLTDPPICGQEVLNVLSEISKNSGKSPHMIVNKYTSGRFSN